MAMDAWKVDGMETYKWKTDVLYARFNSIQYAKLFIIPC